MDISRIERRLKKINSVLDVFKEDNKLTSIEKDLLLGYVREVYDLIRESESDVVEVSNEILKHEVKTIKAESPKPAEAKKEEISQVIEKSVPEVMSTKIEEIPVFSKPIVEVEKPVEVIVEAVKESKPVVKEIEAVIATPASFEISEELEAIFVQEEVSDLSEKLSMSKIEDISRVIGINERIFTINELFGSDGKLFESTLNKLNKAPSFDVAKSIIINEVAIPMNWERDNKLKKAQQFIKHVRRKFN